MNLKTLRNFALPRNVKNCLIPTLEACEGGGGGRPGGGHHRGQEEEENTQKAENIKKENIDCDTVQLCN